MSSFSLVSPCFSLSLSSWRLLDLPCLQIVNKQIRTLRIADGPDEAHLQQLGKRENRERKDEIIAKFARQKDTAAKLFKSLGLTPHELGAEKFRAKL